MNHPRILLLLAVVASFALLLIAADSASAGYERFMAPTTICADASGAAELDEMRCLLNYARKKHHLRKLKVSAQLDRSSESKAEMIVSCNDFSHTPCHKPFATTFKNAHYSGSSYGENIAYEGLDSDTNQTSARDMFRAWLYSKGHRENIFRSRWSEEGMARIEAEDMFSEGDVVIWVSQFGCCH